MRSLVNLFVTLLLPSLLGSALISWAFTRLPHILPDEANYRSSHTGIVPRGGGIALLIPLALFGIYWLYSNDIPLRTPAGALLIGSVFFSVLGFIDDMKSLPAMPRLLIQIFFAFTLSAFSSSDKITFFGTVEISGLSVLLFKTLWITAVVNFYNFMDGLDALAGIQALFISLFCAFSINYDRNILLATLPATEAVFQDYQYQAVMVMNLVLAFSLMGFLIWNKPKAKIFMGDSGSYLLGFFFAMQALLFPVYDTNTESILQIHRHPVLLLTDFSYVALLIFPFLVDPCMTLILRFREKKKLMEAHREHLYQLLFQSGWSVTRVDLLFVLFNIILFLPAVMFLMTRSRTMYILFYLFNVSVLSILFYYGNSSLRKQLKI